MANRIVRVHAGIYGMGIYAIMLSSSGPSVAHYCTKRVVRLNHLLNHGAIYRRNGQFHCYIPKITV